MENVYDSTMFYLGGIYSIPMANDNICYSQALAVSSINQISEYDQESDPRLNEFAVFTGLEWKPPYYQLHTEGTLSVSRAPLISLARLTLFYCD